MTIEKEIDFRKRPLVFIDVETTGLDPHTHEIIEIGCLIVNGESFKTIDSYNTKVKPLHPETADPGALKINGYSSEKWLKAVEPVEAFGKLAKIARGGMVVGWNISFDWGFLEENFRKLGIVHYFDYHKLDVQVIAYSKLWNIKEVKKIGLRPVASYFRINLADIHGAEEDIRITYEIFKKFMQE